MSKIVDSLQAFIADKLSKCVKGFGSVQIVNLPLNTSWTAPGDGIISVRIGAESVSSQSSNIYISKNSEVCGIANRNSDGGYASTCFPVKKGDVIKNTYQLNVKTVRCEFTPIINLSGGVLHRLKTMVSLAYKGVILCR